MAAAIWCAAAVTAPADVVLELTAGSEYTVEQAFPHSSSEIYPITGDSFVAWARIVNVGPEVFEATGPGGMQVSSSGTTALWHETPSYLWDPLANPDDALVITPLGYRGVTLDPGESFALGVIEIWGLSASPLGPAPVGSFSTFSDLTLSFWAGFDRDPNDPSDLPDVFLPLDSAFTVTVVPEPGLWAVLALAFPLLVAQRRLLASAGPGGNPRRRRNEEWPWGHMDKPALFIIREEQSA